MRRGKVELALERSLQVTPLLPGDEATCELARIYARGIDGDSDKLTVLGRQLLDTLIQLGLTPKARAAITNEPLASAPGLDELRARRIA